MYIIASSTISHQLTFQKKEFSLALSDLKYPSTLIHPNYDNFIPKTFKRRMSDVLKMAIACAHDSLNQVNLNQPDAIIVGTCMGCSLFTRKFLDKILSAKEGLISPTAFILSTHNTIAGQLSLILGNHSYNMTHTQNSLSFEQALIDSMLCIKNGFENVLVGAADEEEDTLFNINARLNTNDIHPVGGASFFILSSKKTEYPSITLSGVKSIGLNDSFSDSLTDFVRSIDSKIDDIDLVLYSHSNQKTIRELTMIFDKSKLKDYQKITGVYFTNVGFALHYGVDILLQEMQSESGKTIKKILIVNNLIPENLGLILIDSNIECDDTSK